MMQIRAKRVARILSLLVLPLLLSACATYDGRSPRVQYGVGVRHYYGHPWGAYHAADVIDTVDTIDAIDSVGAVPYGAPDMGGGMDMGFDW